MPQAARSSRSSSSSHDWKSVISGKGAGLPSRLVLHGVEGIGKTSFSANAPSPIFIQARGETGLETLIDSGRLGETDHFPETLTWSDVLGQIRHIAEADHSYKTLVLDTLNGVERLCHEHVCNRDYNGEWGKKGFTNYQQGYDVALADWRELLNLLDQVRTRKIAVIALVHSKVSTFKNPEGGDYDRWTPDMHHKTWSLTHKWADIVCFANFYTEVNEDRKGKGGQQRFLYAVRHAAYDAKNRHGLPEEISMGDSGKEAWNNFIQAMRNAKPQPTTKGDEK